MSERQWLNITAAEYHELDAISSSMLKAMEKEGPMDYHAQYIAKQKQRPATTAQRMGTAFHSAMENPDCWDKSYLIIDEVIDDKSIAEQVNEVLDEKKSSAARCEMGAAINRRQAAHKMYLAEVERQAAEDGREIMTAYQYAIVEKQIAAVYDNPGTAQYVGHRNPNNVELACLWDCPYGMPVKALVDLLVDDTIVDFKTTRATQNYDWFREGKRHGYAYQAAHYLYVTGLPKFCFISVTSEAALKTGSHCEAMLWDVTYADLAEAHEANMKALSTLQTADLLSGNDPLTDSQGVPEIWHNEGWGSLEPLPMSFAAFGNEAEPEEYL